MKSSDNHENELERRERELRQREVELRLREMEAEINTKAVTVYNTVKHQPEKTEKPQPLWRPKVILGLKLFCVGLAALLAVRIAAVLSGIVIVGLLVWLSYKLFIESKQK